MPSRDPLTSEFHSLNTGLLALSSCLDFMSISNCSWSRVILICWGLAIVPALPLMFNKTIFNHWEGKDNCKCFLPLDDVSISDSQFLDKAVTNLSLIFVSQKVWMFWTCTTNFLIPTLLIFVIWAIMLHHYMVHPANDITSRLSKRNINHLDYKY